MTTSNVGDAGRIKCLRLGGDSLRELEARFGAMDSVGLISTRRLRMAPVSCYEQRTSCKWNSYSLNGTISSADYTRF